MNTSDFKFVWLGQTILVYKVPVDIFNTLNGIYETNFVNLPNATKQLVGKIKKEHSLYFDGIKNDKMHKHNLLPPYVLKWFETEPTSFLNKYKTLDEKLSVIMKKDGAVAKELMSIQYLLQHPEMAVFIKYDDLVVNPEKELRKVYTFLNLPYYQHQFTNLNQITVNGIQYNDSIVGKNMHTIRTEKIMKVENEYKKLIPERFIKEYGHIRF